MTPQSEQFHRFPKSIYDDVSLTLEERVVLSRVWGFANSSPALECYLSYESWAKELGCKRRHAIEVLKSLVASGRLIRIEQKNSTNIWRLGRSSMPLDSASAPHALVHHMHPPSAYDAPPLVHHMHPSRSLLEDQRIDHKESEFALTCQPVMMTASHDDNQSPFRGTQKIEIPISESETQFEDSVVKESLTTQESPSLVKPSEESSPPQSPSAPPSKKSRRPREPLSLCPAPSEWLTAERMGRLKAAARELPAWASLSESDLESAITNLAFSMHTWSEGKNQLRPGWELTFKKWLPNHQPQARAQNDHAVKRARARDLFSRLVEVSLDASCFRSAFEKVPILAQLYDSDEAIGNYRDQLKPLEKGSKDYEITEAVFVKRFLDKASQCQR